MESRPINAHSLSLLHYLFKVRVQALQSTFEAHTEHNAYYGLIGLNTEQWWTGEIWKPASSWKCFFTTAWCQHNKSPKCFKLPCWAFDLSTCLSLHWECAVWKDAWLWERKKWKMCQYDGVKNRKHPRWIVWKSPRARNTIIMEF